MPELEKAGTPFDVKPGQPALHLREWTDEEKAAFIRMRMAAEELQNLLRTKQESKHGKV
jgi:hypothetical protein